LSSTEYLGIIAGVFTTLAVIPQIMRVYKLKSALEISLIYTSLVLLGLAFWLAYGIMLGLISLIIWNSIGIVLSGWLLFVKIKYGRIKKAS
jgi:MtN3 and saliva related transmembrane protein